VIRLGRGSQRHGSISAVGLFARRTEQQRQRRDSQRFLQKAPVLLRDEGMRLVAEIAGLIGLELTSGRPAALEVGALCSRLAAAGYRLRTDPDLEAFAAKREEHARCIEAIASHLGTPPAPLLP
jgi:hypothetical protein